MSDTNAAQIVETPSAPAAAESEAMTPAERAYFESRGENTSGLFEAPKKEPEIEAPASEAVKPADGGDDSEPGEIEINSDGTARDTKTGRFVPKSAYLRVRDEAKSAREQASKYRDAAIQARERLALYAEATGDIPGRHAQPEAPPKPEEDIFGFAAYMAKRVEQLEGKLNGDTEQRALKDAFSADVRAFVAKEPAFAEAYGYLAAQLDAELAAMGMADPGQRQAYITQQQRNLVTQSLKQGRSAAETIFGIAKVRGWQPKQQANAAAEAAKKAADEIDKLKAAQQAGVSLRGAGAPGVPDALTPERIANMGDAEFSRTRTEYIGKHGRAAWNRLMGMG